MSERCAESPQNGFLEPGYALVFRGLAGDAQIAKLEPLLAKLLSLPPQRVTAMLEQAPWQLVEYGEQQRMRRNQLALASLGCISSLEPVWRYHHWVLSEATRERLQLDQPASSPRTLGLLRFQPAPGRGALEQLSRRCETPCQVLNSSDLLLDCPQDNSVELAQAIKQLLRQARAQKLNFEAQSALALAPQDGEQAAELLDCLDQRLATATDPACKFEFGAEVPLGGRAWWALIGSVKPQQQALELQALWPTLAEANQRGNAESAEQIRQRWARAQAQRKQALGRLQMHCDRLDKLPSLPTTVMKIHQLAASSDDNGRQLSQLVAQDPSLSARILTLVNSSWFGLKARVESIEHALMVVGREELANLALMISSEKVFRGLNSDAAQRLWQHSSRVAEIARALARRAQHPHPSHLFTAGLLHDVGKILLLSFETQRMQELQQQAREAQLPEYELEREYWGHDHATLGAVILASWGLPDSLCHLVAQHHGPRNVAQACSTDAALIALADHLAHRLDHSEPHGDVMRLRQAQLQALQPAYGQLTLEALDLLAADLQEDLRGPV